MFFFQRCDNAAEPVSLRAVASAAVTETLQQAAVLSDARIRARRVLEKAERLGVTVLSVFDPNYPRTPAKYGEIQTG